MNNRNVTITKEQLTEWVSQLDSDGGCDATDHQLAALIRQSLVAMNSEPVGEFYEEGPLNWYQISDGDRVPASRRILLYRHAQPFRESSAIADVIAERQRQQSVKGFLAERDDTYTGGELAGAAISYIVPFDAMTYWPADWHDDSFKPTNERRNLVKAAALIIAEIERIDRKSNGRTK
ncbi:TPA: hypothetical protein QH681_001145 [Klebsiella pneumoniae subsp. pneumoniae]|nr:hypothetical protein [Klebsiella pneumoniae subsp. pneumoniae]